MSAALKEMESIEAQYEGKRFSEMPAHVQECWSELFEQSERELFSEE